MIDPAVGALLAGAFALLFASASLHKLLDLKGFSQVFAAYRLVPRALARAAFLVPLLELLIGLGLLAGAARAGAAAAGAVLLTGYGGAVAINLARGRRELTCGCGGPNDKRPIAAWMVWRNLALALTLLIVGLPWALRPLTASDALTIGAGTAVAALLYMSLDTLLGRVAPRAALMRDSP
ncbi:MAG TPA: MauE/DoxX family redox-associated membrane protein [Steroidobacteraceae bacterium]|jgi:hypothetical protein